MRALVTGGGGFIGRYIVEQLVRRGDAVRVLGRHRYPDLENAGVETVQADIRDGEAVALSCRDVDVVFHAASKVGHWGKREEFTSVNFDGTQNVVRGCRRHGVRRLVYTSSASVVFDHADLCNVDETCPYPARYRSHYAETKAMAEKLVIAENAKGELSTLVLRPHLVWGPGDNSLVPALLHHARNGTLRIVGDGGNRVDVTYVENAADAHVLACDRLAQTPAVAGRVYFISQGEPVYLWEFVNSVLAHAGIPAPAKRVPYALARTAGAVLEFLCRTSPSGTGPRITRFLAAEMARSHFFDISRARRDLGYLPRVSIPEGLERLAASLR